LIEGTDLLLFLSFLVTGLGHMNLAAGKPAEIWGVAGVLKYPQGAALHAIQFLPAMSRLSQRLRVRRTAWMVSAVLRSQSLFLTHALWQTLLGRAGWDVARVGEMLLTVSLALLIVPIVVIGAAWGRSIRRAV
jgi:hypothetical protein